MPFYLGLDDERFRGVKNRRKVFKQILYERADEKCQICGQPITFEEAHLDHILPAKQGGANHYTNFQIAHGRCNSKKGGKLPPGMKPGRNFAEIRKRRTRIMDQKISKRRARYEKDLLAMIDNDKWTEEAFRILFNEYREDCEKIERKYDTP